MRDEKLNFSVILRVVVSLFPLLFGMSLPAMIWCAFNIAMSYIVIGPKTGFVSSLCAICVSMLFCGTFGEWAKLEGLFIAAEAILCALACVYIVLKRKDFYTGLWLASAGYLIPNVISLRNAATEAGMNIAQFLTKLPLDMVKVQFDSMNAETGGAVDAAFFEQILDTVEKLTVAIIPSILIIVSVGVGYAVVWCVCARLRSLPIRIDHSFSMIKIPRTMSVVMIFSILICLLRLEETVNFVFLNVFAVLYCLCFFAGISLCDFFMRRFIKNPFMRVIVYGGAVVFASAFVTPVLSLLALIDSFVDFRKIRRRGCCCEAEEREN